MQLQHSEYYWQSNRRYHCEGLLRERLTRYLEALKQIHVHASTQISGNELRLVRMQVNQDNQTSIMEAGMGHVENQFCHQMSGIYGNSLPGTRRAFQPDIGACPEPRSTWTFLARNSLSSRGQVFASCLSSSQFGLTKPLVNIKNYRIFTSTYI